jgi:uncharacterized cupredoxin-like copper-binding protein
MRRFLTFGVLVVAMLWPTVPANAAPQPKKVNVKVFEFDIRPNLDFVAEGLVTFKVKNIGTEKHEFVVVRVESPDAEPPTKADGSVDEDAIDESNKIGELEDIKKKNEKSLTKKLDAGDYEVFCNIVEDEDGTTVSHYARGMHASFRTG